MKIIKNTIGLYFVTDRGFVGKTNAEATQFDDKSVTDVQKCLRSAGLSDQIVEDAPVATVDGQGIIQNADGTSFAIRFVRPKDVRSDGSISQRKRRYSPRRFKEEWEAKHHANRFAKIESHKGFVIDKVKEPVNAWVNKGTGRTNPEIGKRRTNRD